MQKHYKKAPRSHAAIMGRDFRKALFTLLALQNDNPWQNNTRSSRGAGKGSRDTNEQSSSTANRKFICGD